MTSLLAVIGQSSRTSSVSSSSLTLSSSRYRLENTVDQKVADLPLELELGRRFLLLHRPFGDPLRKDELPALQLPPAAAQKGIQVNLMPLHRRIRDAHDRIAVGSLRQDAAFQNTSAALPRSEARRGLVRPSPLQEILVRLDHAVGAQAKLPQVHLHRHLIAPVGGLR